MSEHYVIRYAKSHYLGPSVLGRVYPVPQWLGRKDPLVARFSSKEAALKHLCWVICRHPDATEYRRAIVVRVRRRVDSLKELLAQAEMDRNDLRAALEALVRHCADGAVVHNGSAYKNAAEALRLIPSRRSPQDPPRGPR